MEIRAEDLKQYMNDTNPEKKMEPVWFEQLRNDLCAPKHPKNTHYLKYFSKNFAI